jgi:hypothetical protein
VVLSSAQLSGWVRTHNFCFSAIHFLRSFFIGIHTHKRGKRVCIIRWQKCKQKGEHYQTSEHTYNNKNTTAVMTFAEKIRPKMNPPHKVRYPSSLAHWLNWFGLLDARAVKTKLHFRFMFFAFCGSLLLQITKMEE